MTEPTVAPARTGLLAAARARVDGGSLAAVRVALGAVVVLSAVRTWAYGWTDSLYAGTTHRFTYLWMGWVPQPGPMGIRVLVAVTAAAGIAIAVGWRTRAACLVLLVTFGWIEAIDATTYLNHYWFVTLLAALGLVVPFGATASLDARRRARSHHPLGVARGWLWLLRFQVAVVYVSAGFAKLQADWLVRALPLSLWLPARADLPVVGEVLTWSTTAHVASVAGAVFDCLVIPALLWRRTRPFAYVAVVAFHVITWTLFPIGVFPWLMVAMATIFFEPDWPRRLAHRARRLSHRVRWRPTPDERTNRTEQVGAASRPICSPRGSTSAPPGLGPPTWRTWTLGAVAIAWVVIQIALPLRHFAYPGDHRWTGEGYRFGWNVLLVERMASVTFIVHDPATGRTWTADPAELYTPAQLRVMASEPDLIAQAAQAIATDEATEGHPDVEVTVDAWLSFNGRPAERWIDPTVDLAAEPRGLGHKAWILPRP